MTLQELLHRIRTIYVDELAKAAKADAISEPAYRTADGALATEGVLNLPVRVDAVPRGGAEAGRAVTVGSPRRCRFQPASLKWAGRTTLRLSPFVWDNVRVELPDVPSTSDFTPLREWFLRWFDLEDEREPDTRGLQGVVHFFSDPQPDGGGSLFQADLGSAPVEAFEDLLDALSACGARTIRVS